MSVSFERVRAIGDFRLEDKAGEGSEGVGAKKGRGGSLDFRASPRGEELPDPGGHVWLGLGVVDGWWWWWWVVGGGWDGVRLKAGCARWLSRGAGVRVRVRVKGCSVQRARRWRRTGVELRLDWWTVNGLPLRVRVSACKCRDGAMMQCVQTGECKLAVVQGDRRWAYLLWFRPS